MTYNGREQLPEVTATGSTTGGTAITFRYGLTAVQAADETQALKTVPAFTDAGIYTVYYTASAANHDSVSGSFEIEIKNASITGVDAAGYTTDSPTESRSPFPETLETVRSFTVSPKITARSQKALYTRTQAAIPYTTR